MVRRIVVLGSTGSVGTQTLKMVGYSRGIQVTALTAGGNVKLMEEQIREFRPGLACLWNGEKTKELRAVATGLDAKAASGMEGLMEAAALPETDLVVAAMVGMIGIRPAIAAMETGRDIALTNEETLMTADHIVMPLVREKGVKLLPVDSEHSAILQRLQGAASNPLHKILLTTSGGPFRGFTREQLRQVWLEGTLKHPNWSMGHKITVGSSTMINKGLEVMEVYWLFGVEMDQAQVVVQPVDIIRSMVEFEDGTVIAQSGTPDMELPIQCALYYPERRFLSGKRLGFAKLGQIAFEIPDMETFRGLKLAYEAGRRGGTLPTVFNVANKMVAALFLGRKISYLTIVNMIGGAMEHHYVKPSPDVAQILEAGQEAYDYVKLEWN